MSNSEIFGLDTSADDAARLMTHFVRKDWVEMEPALYSGKWFDYRFMNPVQATYLYAHEFTRFYRLTFSKNYSSARGDFVSPLTGKDLFALPERKENWSNLEYTRQITRKKRQISGIWRGRQTADAMGMPYDAYCEFAFYWTMRYWQQAQPPRPSQLYTDLVTDRAAQAWEERSNAMLFYSKLPQYKNTAYERICQALTDPAYEGKILQSQNAHHEWLFSQLNNRHDDPELFAQLIFKLQVLPAAKVRDRVGEETYGLIVKAAESFPH